LTAGLAFECSVEQAVNVKRMDSQRSFMRSFLLKRAKPNHTAADSVAQINPKTQI
jgi:hypothetical protein